MARTPMAKKGLPAGTGAAKILLVDDDPLVRSLGREILEYLGYRVEVAREGLEAVRLYREQGGADLVILDFFCPGKTAARS